jgi:hypothetical protein
MTRFWSQFDWVRMKRAWSAPATGAAPHPASGVPQETTGDEVSKDEPKGALFIYEGMRDGPVPLFMKEFLTPEEWDELHLLNSLKHLNKQDKARLVSLYVLAGERAESRSR